MSTYSSMDYPMHVEEHGDGAFTIHWDENNPLTSPLNTWTKEDFLRAITQGLEDEIFIMEEEKRCAKK